MTEQPKKIPSMPITVYLGANGIPDYLDGARKAINEFNEKAGYDVFQLSSSPATDVTFLNKKSNKRNLGYVLALLLGTGAGAIGGATITRSHFGEQHRANLKSMTEGMEAFTDGHIASLEAEASILEHMIETQDYNLLNSHLEYLKQEIKDKKKINQEGK